MGENMFIRVQDMSYKVDEIVAICQGASGDEIHLTFYVGAHRVTHTVTKRERDQILYDLSRMGVDIK